MLCWLHCTHKLVQVQYMSSVDFCVILHKWSDQLSHPGIKTNTHDMGKSIINLHKDSMTVYVHYSTVYRTVGLSNSSQVMLATLALIT